MGGIGSGRHHSSATIERRVDEYDREMDFQRMLLDTPLPWCWACGRGGKWADIPPGWCGPWLIERAHIIAGNRLLDVRAVVLLCSLCHKIQHGERISLNGQRVNLPRLDREHLLWLKFYRDREHYDRELLQTISTKRLPLMRQPPSGYMNSYRERRGAGWERKRKI